MGSLVVAAIEGRVFSRARDICVRLPCLLLVLRIIRILSDLRSFHSSRNSPTTNRWPFIIHRFTLCVNLKVLRKTCKLRSFFSLDSTDRALILSVFWSSRVGNTWSDYLCSSVLLNTNVCLQMPLCKILERLLLLNRDSQHNFVVAN